MISVERGRKMILRKVFLIFLGSTYGFLSAAGVITVLLAIGLVPRFAGRTHTANKVYLYEEMVIWGTVMGCFVSVFEDRCALGAFLQTELPRYAAAWKILGSAFLIIAGLCCGMFIGCLSLAIAEMLDSIPIFTRRISFHVGLPAAIFSMALGKLTGALFYFMTTLRQTAE